MIGTWEITTDVQYCQYAGGVETSREPIANEKAQLVVYANSATLNGVECDLAEEMNRFFGRNSEKNEITVYSLKVNDEKTKVIMAKVESETVGEGMKNSYLYVKTMTKIPSTVSFKVTFDFQIPTQEVLLGEKVSLVADPVKEGMVFVGWYSGEQKYDFSRLVSSDINLTARWDVVKYVVTFDSGVPEQTVAYGQKATCPPALAKDGFTFVGWNNGDVPFDFNTPVTGNLALTSVWKEVPKEVTITFDSDSGTAIPPITILKGLTIKAPASPDREGMTFNGWYKGESLFDFSTPIEESITLKAKWDAKVLTYALNFFDTKFYYDQCKDVQWSASNKSISMSGPSPLYDATTSTQLSVSQLSDGAYIKFAPTEEEGYFSQTLYAKDGSVKKVLSKKGLIAYFGEYGFLYKADPSANNAYTEYCSYFYTVKGLNLDGSTPKRADYAFTYETVKDVKILENFGK